MFFVFCYEEQNTKNTYFGDELMNIGLITTDGMCGQVEEIKGEYGDFDSRLYVLKAVRKNDAGQGEIGL